MSQLNDIYSSRILELAAAIPRTTRLERPDATATAHSKLCGSIITVDVMLDGVRIADFGQTVKACLLGQASSSAVAARIVGSTVSEVRRVAAEMRRMLKEGGPPPADPWSDLAALQPVKDFKARHTSTLLIFEAREKAFVEIEGRRAGADRTAQVGVA
jgi:NifU-like protein involved in Fe-S cluster formation